MRVINILHFRRFYIKIVKTKRGEDMKKTIITLIMITAVVSFAFADEGEQAVAKKAPKRVIKEVTLRTDGTELVVGKVDSVTPADLLTTPRSRIQVIDSTGKCGEFVVKALAVIYDSAGKFLSLDNVQPGQEVQVNYIKQKDGTNEAVAVRILK